MPSDLMWGASAVVIVAVLAVVRRGSETLLWARSRYRVKSVVEASGVQFFDLTTDVLDDMKTAAGEGVVSADEFNAWLAGVAAELKLLTDRSSSKEGFVRAPFLFPALGTALVDKLEQGCDLVTDNRGPATLKAKAWLERARISLMRLRIASLPTSDEARRVCQGYLAEARADVSRAVQVDAAMEDEAEQSDLLRGLLIGGRRGVVIRRDAVLATQIVSQAAALLSAAAFLYRFSPCWLLGAAPFLLLGTRSRIVRSAVLVAIASLLAWLSGQWLLGATPVVVYGVFHLWVAFEAWQFVCPVCGSLSTAIRLENLARCDFCGTESKRA